MFEDNSRDSGPDDACPSLHGRGNFHPLLVTATLDCALTLAVNEPNRLQRRQFNWVALDATSPASLRRRGPLCGAAGWIPGGKGTRSRPGADRRADK